jgi:hypothetical protein
VAHALEFTYHYDRSSFVEHGSSKSQRIALATCNSDQSVAYFFEGALRKPRLTGQVLFTLSEIVRTRFWEPIPMGYSLYDPVLTSHPDILRLEGFSGCCGVYARADLPAGLFDGETRGRGTTNVDFNEEMRRGLLALRDGEHARFSVGAEEVVLTRGNHRVVEKKVKLPLRWLKGFSEAQAYLACLEPQAEVSAANALRFVRALPRPSSRGHSAFIVPASSGLRITQRPTPGCIPISGTHRLKVIEPLLHHAHTLRMWLDPKSGASGWELRFEEGSFFLLLSPELHRGFSGEGQILETLARPPSDAVVAEVRAKLAWQSLIAPGPLAAALDTTSNAVEAALAVLGSRGLVGFDATAGRYFHRELPFDLAQVEAMQPRLKSAHKLVEARAICAVSGDKLGERVFEVKGSETVHRVRLTEQGEKCTCPWFSKHQGQRGPCKHILAVQMIDTDEREGAAA